MNAGSPDRRPQTADGRPFLYLVTDRHVVPDGDLPRTVGLVAEALPPGSLAVEVREKDLPARAALDLVRAIRAAARSVPVLVNDRLDVAFAAGAEGVHLPGSGLPSAEVRRFWSGRIGVSTHSVGELAALDPREVDLATFGPVFATPTKLRYGAPQGIANLRAAVAASRVPVVAIGGIDAVTVPELKGTGVAGIAVIRAVLAAPDPGEAARRLMDLLG